MPKRKNSRNAAGTGSIRQRKDGRWEARYTIGNDPGTGKQLQKSIYGETQAEVRKKLLQASVDLENGVYIEPSKMTTGQWLTTWLKDYTGNLKDATSRSYQDNVRIHITPAIGSIPLQKLNAHTIQGFYNDLSSKGRIQQKGQKKEAPAGLSAKSVKIIHSILHSALKQAVAIGYLKYNPSEACTLPRIERKEMRIMQADEMSAFISQMQGHKHFALFYTALFTGLRRGELLGLTWDVVDFSNGVLSVVKQLQRERVKGGVLRFVSLKNDKTRQLELAASVVDVLKDHRRRQSESRLACGEIWEDNNLVFCNETGGFLDPDAVYKSFKKLAAQAGVPGIRLHDLRHTFATVSLANGDDVKTVQSNLGHHSAAFTLDVYAHSTDIMKKQSAERMDAFIKGIETCKG